MKIACRCDGRYAGCDHGIVCGEDGGGYRSPYFCADCDQRRIAHITEQFEQLKMSFSDPDATREGE